MSLADFYDPNKTGGLEPGKHRVVITGTRFFDYNSGSRGVEFAIRAPSGSGKFAFCLKDTAIWKLANFAHDCGFTDQEMRRVDHENEKGFMQFVGKEFVAVVEKPDKYSQVVDWEKLDDNIEPGHKIPMAVSRTSQAAPAKPSQAELPADDDRPPMVDENGLPF